MPDSIYAEITLGGAWPSIGDAPGYYTLLIPGLDIRGFPELSMIRNASKLLGCALGKGASSVIYVNGDEDQTIPAPHDGARPRPGSRASA